MIYRPQFLIHFAICLLLSAFTSPSAVLAQSWYNADTHLHAHCAGLSWSAAELLELMKQEGINVGSVLVWGGGPDSLLLDSEHFRGQQDDPVSEPVDVRIWHREVD